MNEGNKTVALIYDYPRLFQTNCIFTSLPYTGKPMLQYELKHTTEYLGTDSVIIDDGSLEEIDITIAENTEIRYLFLPRRSGTFSRKFHLAE